MVTSHYTENDNSPVIHHSHVTAILVFYDVLDFVEAQCSIYQNIQYFIRSKNCALNFTAVDTLCTSAVKLCYAKMTIHHSSVTCFPVYWSSCNQEKHATE